MKTLAIFTIFVLISGVAFTSSANNAYAQNDPSILLRIATQADKQILNQLDRSYGDSIPSKIQTLYEKGHASVESLKNSLPDNIEQAREDFLTAMKSFKQITRMISEPITESKISAYTSESYRDFSSELDRLEKHVKNLKKISEKHNSEINFDEIDNLINEAHIQIDNEIDNTSEIIDKLKDLIYSIEKEIREFASHGASDRINWRSGRAPPPRSPRTPAGGRRPTPRSGSPGATPSPRRGSTRRCARASRAPPARPPCP